MVDISKRIFFVIGRDFLHRSRAIENIKKKILQNKSFHLNTLIFYSKEIEINNLKERVFTFSFDQEKLLVFKNADNLSSLIKNFLIKNLKKIISFNYIILEVEKDYRKLGMDRKFISDKFFNFFLKRGTVFRISSSFGQVTLEDFKRSIRRGNLSSSLYILEKLFERGVKLRSLGPQILGILVQEFSRSKSPIERRRNFAYLWEADRAIKEKGLDSRLTLEILLTKLFSS